MLIADAQSHVTAHYDRRYYDDRLAKYTSAIVAQRLFALSGYLSPYGSVLDFGCGDASVLEMLPNRRKAGIEINGHARSIARRKGLDVRSSIACLEGETFDQVVSSHCLEHVTTPFQTLIELHKLLKPSGNLVLVLPMNDCRDWRQRAWQPGEINQHLFAWTPLTLGNLLAAAKFEPLKIEIHHYTYPRPLAALAAYSPRAYHACARLYNCVRPRPQIIALARPIGA